MNLETRDQLDTYLDDAMQALTKAGALLLSTRMLDTNDWTVYGHLTQGYEQARLAHERLPTVHSLIAKHHKTSNCLRCIESNEAGPHAIDCPHREDS